MKIKETISYNKHKHSKVHAFKKSNKYANASCIYMLITIHHRMGYAAYAATPEFQQRINTKWASENLSLSRPFILLAISKIMYMYTIIYLKFHDKWLTTHVLPHLHLDVTFLTPIRSPWVLYKPIWDTIFNSITNHQHEMVQVLTATFKRRIKH